IAAFIDGRFDGVGRNGVTMLPGYHAIVAAMAWGVGTHSPSTVRILSAILCFPNIVLFFLCARALGKDNRVSLSLLFLLCPLVYPCFVLIYTDIPALLFLPGALFLTLHLWNVPRIGAMLGHRLVRWSIIGVRSFVVYLQTFWADHMWNINLYHWHNRVVR
ncbi:MAG: hypothetical protein OXR07_09610, partial [Nitrospira sp.]|nr:hypothetical protein [Nitrospira sp.]